MWRFSVSQLAGKVIHKGQRFAFMGTIKGLIKNIYIRGQRVQSALFSASTKPIFRSESARYVVFIQMSKEMWDFDADGSGEIMFSKVINGFLPELFKRWQQITARHQVTIVLFTRIEYEKPSSISRKDADAGMDPERTARGPDHRDYYRVVVSDMPSWESSGILIQLKKEFRVFLKDVTIRRPGADEHFSLGRGLSAASDEQPSHVISGQPSVASKGNILEAVNLASSQFSCDYIDRDLVRTGVSVIVITPGTGLFEVDHDLLASTTDNLIDNGVGIDLVCLSRIPLHSVPLFKYKRPPPSTTLNHPSPGQQVLDTTISSLTYASSLSRASTFAYSVSNSYRLASIPSHSQDRSEQWSYGIPHWIDISFWTFFSEEDRQQAVLLGERKDGPFSETYPRRKPFVPRARMYELQMMGVMEEATSNIRISPLTPFSKRCDPSATSIKSGGGLATEPSSFRSQTEQQIRSGLTDYRFSKAKAFGLSGSASSAMNVGSRSPMAQFRWMDEYDDAVFRHPNLRGEDKKIHQSHARQLSPNIHERRTDSVATFGTSPNSTLSSNQNRREVDSNRDKDRNTGASFSNDSSGGKRTDEKRRTAMKTARETRILNPKATKSSRQISFGLRGFNVATPKATASTEISNEHAKSADMTSRGSRQRKGSRASAQSRRTQSPSASTSAIDADDLLASTQSNVPHSARPIPIRNLTSIRINPQSALIATDDTGSAYPPVDPVLIEESKDEHHVHADYAKRSTAGAMAPWLTVINPSNPTKTGSVLTSRLGRWQHVFPKRLRASKIKWKSLCSPAAIPLTTEDYPTANDLATDYESNHYTVESPKEDEMMEQPRSRDWLVREMVAFRFSQGFQVVVGSQVNETANLPLSEAFTIFDDSKLSEVGTSISMIRGSLIHKISSTESGGVTVETLSRRPVAALAAGVDPARLVVYNPMVRTMLAESYETQSIPISSQRGAFDWKLIDAYLAGHERQEPGLLNENLRSWRARLVLIPINPSSTTRRPLHSLNEDNEEERRLEGIRKLTQVWQRFRYLPPSERRFQAPTRKRKDPNPLDIMYQTRNPSAIVTAEKDNMGEDVSTGKPVQLLPESELFQRSGLNLPALAQTIQGEKGVRMMDRRWHWRLHYNCFIGFELTSWLLQNFRDVDTREEAVELGNELMKSGLFQHVEQRHNFRDGNYFYQVAIEHRAPRPESRSLWFAPRKTDKSVPSTPISDGLEYDSPKPPGSRSSLVNEKIENDPSLPVASKQRLSVALSKSLLYDVDHRKRSYRPELINLHYDRLHNPDNCYHIRIDWMNTTSKLIEDAIVSWATSVDRYGLKLVEVPIAEASAITSMHPFRAPSVVKLAQQPPVQQPQSYFDATSFTPQARIEKHFYHKAIMKRFDFVLDFEAASDFPSDVDVSYSWGKPDYKFPQYIHRSGTVLAQITDDGDFLLLANRLYNNRSVTPQESGKIDEKFDRGGRHHLASTGKQRGSPRTSPFSSPHTRAMTDVAPPFTSSAAGNLKTASTFETPELIKQHFEDFCGDAASLDSFYSDVLSKASSPGTDTPVMESSIPALGLPPSLVLRDTSPGPDTEKLKTRIIDGGPKLASGEER